ncbi:MAG: hypothetical protein KJ630_07650 [Proteobacteria bacterium]|nr:hypothetical protein [Pseudomonadota bacterium]
MNREINQFDEIVKRSLFVIYLALMTSSVVMASISLLKSQTHYLIIAIFIGLCGTAINIVGRRHYDFERFFKAFSLGLIDDETMPDLHIQIESIISQSKEPDINWMERDTLRKQLESLLENRAQLFQSYKKEIQTLHPVLAGKLQRQR